jgi:hypothetical protein
VQSETRLGSIGSSRTSGKSSVMEARVGTEPPATLMMVN